MSARDLARLASLVCACLLVPVLDTWAQAAPVRPGPCEDRARTLFGRPPVVVGDKVAAPKKTRDMAPKYPERAFRSAAPLWVGEALIDPAGKIRDVWVLRAPATDPWPEVSKAITDAIRQWEYEPTRIRGEAVPVCVTVTVRIHVR